MKNLKGKSIRTALILIFMLSPVLNAGESTVRLYEEYVNIHIDKSFRAHVYVKFMFTGTRNYSSVLAFPVSDWIVMENFTATWNGKTLVCEKVDAPDGRFYIMVGERYRSVIKFTVPHTGSDNSEHVVSYTYKVPFISLLKDYEAEGYYIEYILKTGSLWKGRLAKLDISVSSDIPFRGTIKHLDRSYTVQPAGAGKWEFTDRDIELDKNLRLLMR